MQKRLRDAVAALSARWESMPTEGLHELMRSVLARTQVYSDRVDLEVDPAALVRLLLNESGGEETGIGGRASTPAADRAETHSIMLIIPARLKRTGMEMKFVVDGPKGGKAGFFRKVLLDTFEEQLHLPPRFIKGAYRRRGEGKIVGHEHESLACLWIDETRTT